MKKDSKKGIKKIENVDKVVRNILIGLAIVNVIINFLIFPAMTYNGKSFFESTSLYSSIMDSFIFFVIMWGGSILTYIVGIIYVVVAIKSKEHISSKVILTILSVLYTPLTINLVMNFLASFFYINF